MDGWSMINIDSTRMCSCGESWRIKIDRIPNGKNLEDYKYAIEDFENSYAEHVENCGGKSEPKR